MKRPFPSLLFVFLFLLFTFPLLASCSPAAPTAAPAVITVQYTAAAQPWLMNVYKCAGDNIVIAEPRGADYLDLNNTDLIMRVNEPRNLTAPAYQIGSQEIVVGVNPRNQIGNLTVEKVRAIFNGRIARWNELGGNDAPVQVWVFAVGEDVQQVFETQVMGGTPVTSLARLATSPQEMANAIAADVNAIGILTRHWMTGNLQDVFAAASVPVLAITPSEPQGAVAKLLTCLQQ